MIKGLQIPIFTAGKLRPLVFWMPLVVFILIVVLSLISPQAFLKVATSLNNGILAVFSNVFAWAAFCFLLTCIWHIVLGDGGAHLPSL